MNLNTSVTDSELPVLKRLASEIAASEAPELGALDQIASLAAEIAARCREAARRDLIEQLTSGVPALFPSAGDEWQSRVAQSPLDELSQLLTLLGTAEAARATFMRIDGDLMAARERGDYAAMAPLAIEADARKSAFTEASGEVAGRLGIAGVAALSPIIPAAAPEPSAAVEAAREFGAGIDVLEPLTPAETAEHGFPAISPPEPPASNLVDLGMRPTTQAERRRIRDLIRQVRAAPDEAP